MIPDSHRYILTDFQPSTLRRAGMVIHQLWNEAMLVPKDTPWHVMRSPQGTSSYASVKNWHQLHHTYAGCIMLSQPSN